MVTGTGAATLWDAMLRRVLGSDAPRLILVGTLAPGAADRSGFVVAVARGVEGSGEPGSATSLCCRRTRRSWRDFDEALRVNPVSCGESALAKRVLEREHQGGAGERAGGSDVSKTTGSIYPEKRLTVAAINHHDQNGRGSVARPVPACEGKPVIGVDLGGNRSWSAAAAVWPSGRIEAWALGAGSAVAGGSGKRRSGSGRLVLRTGSVGRSEP